jgi:hypothetical protein
MAIAQEPVNLLEYDDAHYIGDALGAVEESSLPLAQRLGKSQAGAGTFSGVFSFSSEFLRSLRAHKDLDSHISEFSSLLTGSRDLQRSIETSLLSEKLSVSKFERNFAEIYCFEAEKGSDEQKLPLLPFKVVNWVLSRMEREHTFFPSKVFKILLERGCVSDAAHPKLIESIIATGDINTILAYVDNVPDLRETSMYRIVEYVLDATFSCATPLHSFTMRDTVLLTLLAYDFNEEAMEAAFRRLSTGNLAEMLTLIERLLVEYGRTHTELYIAADCVELKLPSRENVCRWLKVLIDSQSIVILKLPAILARIESIGSLIANECHILENLLAIEPLLSTLTCAIERSCVETKKSSPKQLAYTNYAIESAYF